MPEHVDTELLSLDPINVRQATDCRNMQIRTMHSSARYRFVPAATRTCTNP